MNRILLLFALLFWLGAPQLNAQLGANNCPTDGSLPTLGGPGGVILSLQGRNISPGDFITRCFDIDRPSVNLSAVNGTNLDGQVTITVRDRNNVVIGTIDRDEVLLLNGRQGQRGFRLTIQSNATAPVAEVDLQTVSSIGTNVATIMAGGVIAPNANGCEADGTELDYSELAGVLSGQTVRPGTPVDYCFDVPVGAVSPTIVISDNDLGAARFEIIDEDNVSTFYSGNIIIDLTPFAESNGLIFRVIANFVLEDEINIAVTSGGVSLDEQTFIAGLEPALPVSLTSFNGRHNGKFVSLDWSTELEVDNEGFEVHRSADGQQWSTLGFVNAAGTQAGNYQFADSAPLNGVNHYRLKQMDVDGGYDFSSVITVRILESNAVQIFPNPVQDRLQVRVANDQDGEMNVRVSDMMGKVLRQGTYPTNGIDVSALPRGTYVITVAQGSESVTQRFVKQ